MSADVPIVGRPVDRETIINAAQGHLVTCADNQCQWQGLFPDRDLAVEAANTHVWREKQRGNWHYGQVVVHLVGIVDDRTATCVTDQVWPGKGEDALTFDPRTQNHTTASGYVHNLNGYGSSPAFPVTPSSHPGVDELVSAGDLIETSGPSNGKVWKVTETRSLGIPTWTIVYVAPEYEGWPSSDYDIKQDCSWLHELVPVDGEIVCRYGDNRTYEVLGEAPDYQAMIGGWSS